MVQPSPPAPSSGCGTAGITCWYWLYNCIQGQLAVIPNATPDYLNSLLGDGWAYLANPGGSNPVATEAQVLSWLPGAVATAQSLCGLPVITVPPPGLVP